MMINKTKRLLQVILTLLFFCALFRLVNFNSFVNVIKQSKFIYQLPLLVIWCLSQILGATALYVLIIPTNIKVPFITIFRRFMILWALAFVTPARSGELLMAPFLKNDGLPLCNGVAIVFIDKAISLSISLFISLIGMYVFFRREVSLFLSSILLFSIIIAFFIVRNNKVESIIENFCNKYLKFLSGYYYQVRYYLMNRKKYLTINLGITLLKFLLHGLFLWTIFLSLDTTVSFPVVLLFSAIVQIVLLIPITFSGLGLREGTMVGLFTMIGVETTVSCAAALICTGLAYIYAGLSWLLFFPELKTIKKGADG